jgi:hypothetical protein
MHSNAAALAWPRGFFTWLELAWHGIRLHSVVLLDDAATRSIAVRDCDWYGLDRIPTKADRCR